MLKSLLRTGWCNKTVNTFFLAFFLQQKIEWQVRAMIAQRIYLWTDEEQTHLKEGKEQNFRRKKCIMGWHLQQFISLEHISSLIINSILEALNLLHSTTKAQLLKTLVFLGRIQRWNCISSCETKIEYRAHMKWIVFSVLCSTLDAVMVTVW